MIWWTILAALVFVPLYGVGTFVLWMTHAFAYDAPSDTLPKMHRIARPVVLTLMWLVWLSFGLAFIGWCSWMLVS
jgi:hypothetical protein